MSARRQHRMPFGTELGEDGVRFRLWAPAARCVELVLYDGDAQRLLEMSSSAGGWFELTTRSARPGQRYRFCIDGQTAVPDPAARANADVHGPSIVVDPLAFEWTDDDWRPRPWHESVIYELHVGTFTPQGTFSAIEAKLDHLADLGVTLIELMPVAEFPGARGWGYDGVLPYAPDSAYGTPDELKQLIVAMHRRGLGVMLDVVYNHFGPEGNWLHAYAPSFFTAQHRTPWGDAINFDDRGSDVVREFFINNALYWLEEFHFDGLRLDAVHAMFDDGAPHFIAELVGRVRAGPGRERPAHIVLENHANEARYLGKPGEAGRADAQWNDDLHHSLHVILTGESDGYYEDYAERPHALLCRSLAEGFAYQGEISRHSGARPRGEPSARLPPTAFVSFLQTHDQIGNRAWGERLSALVTNEAALRAAVAILLLAPAPPLLFMGEEWAADQPFLYFCDFEPDLARRVRAGRRREFARFSRFGDTTELPDPSAPETFARSRLDWSQLRERPHARWLAHYRRLLAIRHREIVPRLPDMLPGRCVQVDGQGAIAVDWAVGSRSILHLLANLTDQSAPLIGRAHGRVIFATHPNIRAAVAQHALEPWSVIWLLENARASGFATA